MNLNYMVSPPLGAIRLQCVTGLNMSFGHAKVFATRAHMVAVRFRPHCTEVLSPLQGFHKILKKHDKMLPHAPCQQFYVAHLHQQKWVQVCAQDHPSSPTLPCSW